YTPGPDDINTGSVVLTLTASGINPCEDSSSDQINVTIEDCTGVDELSNEEISLSLIPNPNHGIFDFTIESLDQNDLTLQIFNLHGQVIFTFKIGQISGVYSNRINMKNYPRGIYFINVQNGKVSQTEKLIIY
ncbi:MAG: T9SS type A sorting domain-containing protein, partial [Bacteroidetes bacterium]|nr:T9SS type A sorting domain-containing protein [Bacteroidota bacterium]